MIQLRSSTSSPTLLSNQLKEGVLPNRPAMSLPRPTIIEYVRVDSQTMRVTLYLDWVHVMLSASTSLPYASVSAISTVSPFLLFMISPGLQLRQLMKFQAIPTVAVTLMGRFYLAIYQMAAKQLQAPLLSKNIGPKCYVPLRSSPPESKQMPLPIRANHSSLALSPLQLKLIMAGSLLLALPTAWKRFIPYFFSQSALMTVMPRPSSQARAFDRWTKQLGEPK